MEGEEVGVVFGEGELRKVWKMKTLRKRSAGAMIKVEISVSFECIVEMIY
mgnify:CR=1 FL=1